MCADFHRSSIERSGPGLPSVERPHIYRLPPSSIFTRKKEKVSEADVMWMTRPDGAASDPSRINEAINYYAKGINPSVEVMYGNYSKGSQTNSLHHTQPGALYKLDSVRPPLFPVETTLPLSRPRTHQNKTVETNPGLPNGLAGNTLAYSVDMENIQNAIEQGVSSGPIPATAYYKIDAPSPMSATWAINESRPSSYETITNPGRPMNIDAFVCREESPYGTIIRPKTSAISNLKLEERYTRNDDATSKVRKEILLQNIRPNFQIVLYDPENHISTQVTAR